MLRGREIHRYDGGHALSMFVCSQRLVAALKHDLGLESEIGGAATTHLRELGRGAISASDKEGDRRLHAQSGVDEPLQKAEQRESYQEAEREPGAGGETGRGCGVHRFHEKRWRVELPRDRNLRFGRAAGICAA